MNAVIEVGIARDVERVCRYRMMMMRSRMNIEIPEFFTQLENSAEGTSGREVVMGE